MADKTIGVHTTDFFNHVGFKTGASLFSELGIVQVPTKSVGPSKPTLSAITAPADSAGVLKVTLVLPTTNTDGSALVRTELIKVALHYKDSPGVDTSDPAIEFPPVEELLWAPSDTDTYYVRIRVMDSHGRWSALSDDEKSAAAGSGIADALAAAAAAQETADGEIVGFYQDSEPTEEMKFGDIWIDTTNPVPTTDDIYRYEDEEGGSQGVLAWRAAPTNAVGLVYLNAATAQSTADGKIVTFYQSTVPTSEGIGDLWIKKNGGYKLYRAASKGADEIAAGEWEFVETATLPEDSGLWAHRLGYESVFTKDSPSAGKVAWANVILYWKDNKYEIDDGNTDKKYIWWDYSLSTTTFQTSDDAPSLELEDVIVVYNDNGTPFMMMYSPMVLADYLRAGKIVSQSIELAVLDGKGDVEIRSGITSGDFDNAGGAQGFIIGVDDSDDDKAKLYFGGPDANNLMRFMKWTGSVLDINADLVCTDDFLFAGLVSNHITYATASPGNALDDMVTNSGPNYTGVVTRNYRVQIDSTGATDTFKWSHNGGATWEATSVAITGSAQTLEDNVKVTFGAKTGHNLNDYWDFTAGDTTVNIHHIAGVYKLFASTEMPADDTRIVLDGFGYGGGIDLYSGPAAGSHVNLHAEGSINLDASGGA